MDITTPQGMKVIGFHFVGPNAGEITQGFSLALKVVCRDACYNYRLLPFSWVG